MNTLQVRFFSVNRWPFGALSAINKTRKCVPLSCGEHEKRYVKLCRSITGRNEARDSLVCSSHKRYGGGGFIFRCSRILLFIGPQKRYSAREAVDFASEVSMKNENIFSDAGLDGSINWNLLGDPSGGLNDGESAEELSEHDLMTEVNARQNGYVAEQFYLLFTPLIDIVSILLDHNLLPENDRRKTCRLRIERERAIQLVEKSAGNSAESTITLDESEQNQPGDIISETQSEVEQDNSHVLAPHQSGHTGRHALDAANKAVSHWFLDGQSALAKPQWTSEKMGEQRYAVFSAALRKYYEPIEAVMPLTRVVRQNGLPEHIFVPFLRQISLDMHSIERRAATVKVVPGVIITLANGRVVPKEMGLPEDDERRVMLVTALFLSVAHETGNTDLAYLAIQLLRAHGLPVPFAFQKQLTNVFSTASRVQTDWKVRSSGVLAECLPKWKEYLKKVRAEVRSGWKASQRRSAEVQESSNSDMSDAPSFDVETRQREVFSISPSNLSASSANLPTEKVKKGKGRTSTSSSKKKQEESLLSSNDRRSESGAKNVEEINDVAQYFTSNHLSSGGSIITRQLESNIRAFVDERVQLWASTTGTKGKKQVKAAKDAEETEEPSPTELEKEGEEETGDIRIAEEKPSATKKMKKGKRVVS